MEAEVDCVYHERRVRVRFRARPAQIPGILRRLDQIGLEPERAPLTFDRTPEGLPICPRHRVPMPRREKQGQEWFSHGVLDDKGQKVYCRGYASPGSPGYEFDRIPQGDQDG